ncbi:hypothetical protein J5N97_018074 [Dioscorea zingiberensis]|uniref:Uncharacterized protein n=1 Tax=Dioscorea zingiberensis TaxID=325984 RepID=A0A9D5CN62_9LILI|nr:hypothetical protein J5N97_018074 [Dioscorea zingiberensis]
MIVASRRIALKRTIYIGLRVSHPQEEGIELYSSIIPENQKMNTENPYLQCPQLKAAPDDANLKHNHKALVLCVLNNLGIQDKEEADNRDLELTYDMEPPDPGKERPREIEMMDKEEPPDQGEIMELEVGDLYRGDGNGSKRGSTAENQIQKKGRIAEAEDHTTPNFQVTR